MNNGIHSSESESANSQPLSSQLSQHSQVTEGAAGTPRPTSNNKYKQRQKVSAKHTDDQKLPMGSFWATIPIQPKGDGYETPSVSIQGSPIELPRGIATANPATSNPTSHLTHPHLQQLHTGIPSQSKLDTSPNTAVWDEHTTDDLHHQVITKDNLPTFQKREPGLTQPTIPLDKEPSDESRPTYRDIGMASHQLPLPNPDSFKQQQQQHHHHHHHHQQQQQQQQHHHHHHHHHHHQQQQQQHRYHHQQQHHHQQHLGILAHSNTNNSSRPNLCRPKIYNPVPLSMSLAIPEEKPWRGVHKIKFSYRWINLAMAPESHPKAALVSNDSLVLVSVHEYTENNEVYFGSLRCNLAFNFRDVIWNPSPHIITGSNDGVISTWDPTRPESSVANVKFHSRPIKKLAPKHDDPYFVIAMYNGGGMAGIDLRVPPKTMKTQITPSHQTYNGLHCNPIQPNLIATIDNNGRVLIWDLRLTKRQVTTILAHRSATSHAVAWHPNGCYVASGGDDKHIKIWDTNIEHNKNYNVPYCDIVTPSYVRGLAWRPNHKTQIASYSINADQRICIWDTRQPYHSVIFQDQADSNVSGFLWYNDDSIWSCNVNGDFVDQDIYTGTTRMSKYLSSNAIAFSPFQELLVAFPHSEAPLSQQWQQYVQPRTLSQHPSTTSAIAHGGDNKVSSSNQARKFEPPYSPKDAEVDVFVNQSSVQEVILDSQDLLMPDTIVHFAYSFSIDPTNVAEACKHNCMVASQTGCTQIAKTWQVLQCMFGNATPRAFKDVHGTPQVQQTDEGLPSQSRGESKNVEQSEGSHDLDSPLAVGPQLLQASLSTHPYHIDPTKSKGLTAFPTRLNIAKQRTVTKQDCHYILDLCEYYGDQANPQMAVTIALVMQHFICLYRWKVAEKWFFEYIAYLDRYQATIPAAMIIRACPFPSISEMNLTNIHLGWNCCNCWEKVEPIPDIGSWYCLRCNRASQICAICLLPIKGHFIWCQGCGHGGHASHITEWFEGKGHEFCPTGCGHQCQINPSSHDNNDSSLGMDSDDDFLARSS